MEKDRGRQEDEKKGAGGRLMVWVGEGREEQRKGGSGEGRGQRDNRETRTN